MDNPISFSFYLEAEETLNTITRKLNFNNQLINDYLTNNNNFHQEVVRVIQDGQTNFTLLDGHYDNSKASTLKVVLNGNTIDNKYLTFDSTNSFIVSNVSIKKADVLTASYVPLERIPVDTITTVLKNYDDLSDKISNLTTLVNTLTDIVNNDLPADLQTMNNLFETLSQYNDKLTAINTDLADKVSTDTFNTQVVNNSLVRVDDTNKGNELLPNYYLDNYGDKKLTEYKTVDSTGTFGSNYILTTYSNSTDRVSYQTGLTDGRLNVRRSYPQVNKDTANKIVSDALAYLDSIRVIPDNTDISTDNIKLYQDAMSNATIIKVVDNKSYWNNSNLVIIDRNAILGLSSSSTTNSDLTNRINILYDDIDALAIVSADSTNRWSTWTEIGSL